MESENLFLKHTVYIVLGDERADIEYDARSRYENQFIVGLRSW
jgi:hypothetical protein